MASVWIGMSLFFAALLVFFRCAYDGVAAHGGLRVWLAGALHGVRLDKPCGGGGDCAGGRGFAG